MSFENTTGDSKYNGKGISDSLLAELQRIKEILYFELNSKYLVQERLPVETGIGAREELHKVLHELRSESQSHAIALANLGSINIPLSKSPISLGPIINLLAQIMMGNRGCLISGSIQKYGSNLRLISHIKHQNKFYHCEVNRKINNDQQLLELIRDLAIKIAYELSDWPLEQKNSNIINPYMVSQKTSKHEQNDEVIDYAIDDNLKKEFFSDDEISKYEENLDYIKKHLCTKKYVNRQKESSPLYESDKPSADVEDLFHSDNIKNPKAFIIKLWIANDPVSRHLRNKHGLNVDHLRNLGLNSESNDDSLKSAIAVELNHLIGRGCLYEKKCFKGINLSSSTIRLLEKYNLGIDWRYLNYLLIMDAYPFELTRKRVRARSWEGFKYFLEALDAFNKYSLSKDKKYLEIAREKSKNAFKADSNYGILFNLFCNLGIAFFDSNLYNESREMFEYATYINNKHAGAFSGIGFNLRYLRKFDEALEIFQIANHLNPNLASPWNIIGNVFYDLGSYAEDLWDYARAGYYQAIKLEPTNPYPWIGMGMVFYRLHDYEKAIINLRKAIKLEKVPDQPLPMLHATLASCYKKLAEKIIQIQTFTEVIMRI